MQADTAIRDVDAAAWQIGSATVQQLRRVIAERMAEQISCFDTA